MSDGPFCEAYSTPAMPHTKPEATKDSHTHMPTLTPDRRAASGFPPVA